jgi:hypothetical protein
VQSAKSPPTSDGGGEEWETASESSGVAEQRPSAQHAHDVVDSAVEKPKQAPSDRRQPAAQQQYRQTGTTRGEQRGGHRTGGEYRSNRGYYGSLDKHK